MKLIYVIGAGGHAKVVISTLLAGDCNVAAVYDDAPSKWGTAVLGIPVVGCLRDFAKLDSPRAVIAIGTNEIRRKLVLDLPNAEWIRLTHVAAYVDKSVQVGPGTVVSAGAVVQPEVVIGAHCIVNTGATVDHDCRIGDYVHVAPGAHLAGGVSVGHGSLIGIGSCVCPGVTIGRDVVVGAGAAVLRDIRDGTTVVGVPARER